ncbi:MAG: LptA/OstA family protein [Acidobacteriota bacterium]
MKGIRAVRMAVLTLLALFAVTVLVMVFRAPDSTPATPAPRAVPDPPEEIAVPGPVESATETFLFTEEKAGVEVTRLSAGQMLGIEGGSRVLSDILIEVHPDPENHPERLARVRGATGRFDASSHEVILQGGVDIHLSSGEELQTARLSYRLDERIARSQEPVEFRLTGGRGRAIGFSVALGRDQVDLASDVVLISGTQEAPTTIHSSSLHHQATPARTILDGEVRISGNWGQFTGHRLVVTPTTAQEMQAVSSAPGRLEVTGGDWSGDLVSSAWTFILGAGHEIQTAIARGDAQLIPTGSAAGILGDLTAATIRLHPPAGGHAARLQAEGDGQHPLHARLVDAAWTAVEASTLDLSGGGDTPRRATFEGDVRAKGVDRTAAGQRLVLRADRTAVLSGRDGQPAQVSQADHLLSAPEIRLDADGGGTARGGVKIDILPRGGSELKGAAPETAAAPLAAMAQEAIFSPDGSEILLQGAVHAWQGDATLEAAWLRLLRSTGRLMGGGGVMTSTRPAGAGARGSETVQVKAREVTWDRRLDQAVYQGTVQLVQGDARVSADRLRLENASDDGSLLTAEGRVLFNNSQWTGSGDRLTYDSGTTFYVLESARSLARVTNKATGSALSGRTLRIDRRGQAVRVNSHEDGRVVIHSGDGEGRSSQ